MLWILFSILLVTLWRIFSLVSNRKLIKMSNKIKCGQKCYPFVGHAYLFVGDGARRMQSFQVLARDAIQNGGRTNLWLGYKYFVIIVDPVDLEVILKTSLEKDDMLRFVRNLLGNGSVFAPVSIWRPRRKILAPIFNAKKINQFVPVFSKHAGVLMKELQSVEGTGPFSLWRYMASYNMNSVCETAFGVEVNAQKDTDKQFLKAFDECCQLAAARMLQPWLYSNAVYRLLPYHATFEWCKKVIYNFVDKAIKAKRVTMKEDGRELKTRAHDMKTFLELLIEVSGGDRGYSDTELEEETLVIVVAGTDTSAVGLSFTVSMLARHPHVQDLVFKELQEVFGDSDRPLTPEDLHRLKYMDAVVRETLRLYPPVPIVARKIERDLVLPSGTALVSGCGVLIHIWGTHRNPQYWGDDAEQFRPERFIDAPLKHPAAYLPFSYGPRNCVGQQFAMMSIKTALATLLRRYRVSMPDSRKQDGVDFADAPITVSFDIMMKDVDGFTVQMERRKK